VSPRFTGSRLRSTGSLRRRAPARARAFYLALLTLGLLLASPGVARAGDATIAETLFREARALMDAGDYARAEGKLAESYRQDPASGTLLALAYCQEKAGKTASAWGSYAAAVLRARQDGRADREQAAQAKVSELDDKLSRLVIEVPPETASLPGLIVKRDDQRVSDAIWGSAIPVDPGEHTIEATADGRAPWRATVRVGAGADRQKVSVGPLLPGENSQPTASARAAAGPTGAGSAADRTPEKAGGGGRPLGIGIGVGGILAMGVGAGFALRAQSLDKASKRDGHCDPSGCDDKGLKLNEQALGAAAIATVLTIAGGVVTIGGAAVYLFSAPNGRDEGIVVSPLATQDAAGVLVRGRL
jgi:hypothetical protein